MSVKESRLVKDDLHPNMAHNHFTGPWEVVNNVRGLMHIFRLGGRRVRQRTVAATKMKSIHRRTAAFVRR